MREREREREGFQRQPASQPALCHHCATSHDAPNLPSIPYRLRIPSDSMCCVVRVPSPAPVASMLYFFLTLSLLRFFLPDLARGGGLHEDDTSSTPISTRKGQESSKKVGDAALLTSPSGTGRIQPARRRNGGMQAAGSRCEAHGDETGNEDLRLLERVSTANITHR